MEFAVQQIEYERDKQIDQREKKCILLYVSRLPMLVHRVVRKSLLVKKLITSLCQILFALGIPYFYLSYNGDLIIVSVLHLMLMLHLLLVFFYHELVFLLSSPGQRQERLKNCCHKKFLVSSIKLNYHEKAENCKENKKKIFIVQLVKIIYKYENKL